MVPNLFPPTMDELLIERRDADRLADHGAASKRVSYDTYRRQEYWLMRLESIVARRAAA